MTMTTFRQLLPAERVRWTLTRGTYLVQRVRHAKGFHLYHVPGGGPGFFVELSFEPLLNAIVIVRSFRQIALLEEYVTDVLLPL